VDEIKIVQELVGALEALQGAKLADGTYADKNCAIALAVVDGRSLIEQMKREQGAATAPEPFKCSVDGAASLCQSCRTEGRCRGAAGVALPAPTGRTKAAGCAALALTKMPRSRIAAMEGSELVEFAQHVIEAAGVQEVPRHG
jgi:hypothetical protein